MKAGPSGKLKAHHAGHSVVVESLVVAAAVAAVAVALLLLHSALAGRGLGLVRRLAATFALLRLHIPRDTSHRAGTVALSDSSAKRGLEGCRRASAAAKGDVGTERSTHLGRLLLFVLTLFALRLLHLRILPLILAPILLIVLLLIVVVVVVVRRPAALSARLPDDPQQRMERPRGELLCEAAEGPLAADAEQGARAGEERQEGVLRGPRRSREKANVHE